MAALLLGPDAISVQFTFPETNEEGEAAGQVASRSSQLCRIARSSQAGEAMNQSSHRDGPERGHYTFGDNAIAAVRLQRLADVFRPSLEAFVTGHLPGRPIRHALDLGCGPGHTTRALAALLPAARVTGLDHSASFIDEAARTPEPDVDYRVADVTSPHDVAVPDLALADALYGRFLLTHLPHPADALSTWASYVAPGAVCLLQETAAMTGSHPALARYYELVADLQHRHGQRLDIGRALIDLPDRRLYDVRYSGERRFVLPGARMAELHRLNLKTWRNDPLAASFDPNELEWLVAQLERIADGRTANAVVDYSMGELVLERR